MIEEHLKPDNHTLIEIPLIHVESCELLMSFVQHHFNINKQDQTFNVIDNEESAVLILSYKSGNRLREVGRVLTRFDEVTCCIMIKNYLKQRFIEYLGDKKIDWHYIS